jgi:hypothetical protein
MAAGRVVFDDTPAMLTDTAARGLYGMEAEGTANTLEPGLAIAGAGVVPAT